MKIPILIEPVAGKGYRSRGGEQFSLVAEGATEEEVLAQLNEQLKARLDSGSKLVTLDAADSKESNPWVDFAGMFENDPYFDEWQQAIAENRAKVDADPEIP